ncbi:MAG TPA: DUF5698 domain-containing protein [Longimicrobiales bacterium]|nr:DUF5698 domain-containing protein [Longimicrobiales bacterium]
MLESLDILLAGPWGPIVIFVLRIFDVSLQTLRVVLSVRNARLAVPIIGFFEVLIWIFAVGSAIRNLESGWHILGYAGGFACGSAVGLWIEEKLAIGLSSVRIISTHGGVELAEALRERGFGVTEFAGQGRDGPVEIVYTVLRRRQVPELLEEVDRWDPGAFVTVEEPRAIRKGWMMARRSRRPARARIGETDRR